MDPYLETPDAWRGFQVHSMPELAPELGQRLPESYIVRIETDPYDDCSPGGGGQRRCLRLIDLRNRATVAAVELLSPSIKRATPDRAANPHKRRRLLDGGINLLELDLLRGGTPVPSDVVVASEYRATANRAIDRTIDVWQFALREPLPTVTVPVNSATGSASLNLQALFDRVDHPAGFRRYIYNCPADPPPSPVDAAWAAGRIAAIEVR